MKLTDCILTEKLLTDLRACPEAIEFCRINKLFGFPLSRLDEVEGDYDDYIQWLKTIKSFEYKNDKIARIDYVDMSIIMEYDDMGNMTREISSKFLEEYDDMGNMTRDISSIFLDKRYYYDEKGRKIRMEEASGYWANYSYDDSDNITEFNDYNGVHKLFFYDSYGSPIEVRTNNDDVERNIYDYNRNIVRYELNSHWTNYQYDEKNRLIFTENSNGFTEKSIYDDEEHSLTVMGSDGYYSYSKYDSRGNLIERRCSESVNDEIYVYTYYDNGQLKSVNDLLIPQF